MTSLIPWRNKNSVKERGRSELSRSEFDEFYPLARFRREVDQLWDRFWDDWKGLSVGNGPNRLGWNLDLEDLEGEYVFHAELPGFEPDEIDVSVSGDVMTVRAEHKEKESGKNALSYRYGRFQESFTLPRGIESNNIDARYHSGVLEVHLPKSESEKAKRIPVESA